MLALILIGISVIIGFLYTLWRVDDNLRYWEKKGILSLRTFNDYKVAYTSIFNRVCFADEILHQYNAFPDKSIYGVSSFGLPMLMVKDPEILRQIMIKDFEHFTDHIQFLPIEENDYLFGKNLFALTGERWHAMRTTLSPAFTGNKMRNMFILMQDCGEQLTKYFDKQLNQMKNGDKLEIELLDVATRFTNDVIATVALGIKVDSLENRNNQFYKIGQYIPNFDIWRFLLVSNFPRLAKFFNIRIMPNWIYDFFRNTILETIETREREKIVRSDMIHLLTETKKGLLKHETDAEKDSEFAVIDETEVAKPSKEKLVLTDDDIVAQAFLFFIAGFGNVALTMCWAAYELAVNPDIQNRLYSEIKQTLEDNDGKLNYDILKNMKYLDLIVTETLRKWPVVMFTHRQVTKPYTLKTEDGDINLETGMNIGIFTYCLQRDPKFYSNPEKFDPERFTDQNKIHPFTYLPFGNGPRICIGSRLSLMEVKVFLVHMLSKFEFTVIEKTPIPPRIKNGGTLELKGGFWLGVGRRS